MDSGAEGLPGGFGGCSKVGRLQVAGPLRQPKGFLSLEVEELPGWISRFGTLVGMTKYLARHIVRFVLLMLAVGLVVFALVSASPIDPVQANVGQAAYVNMSEAKRAQLASYWGGDVPFWERFANWAGALLHGDMGTSLRFNAPVSEVIAHRAGQLAGAHGYRVGGQRRARLRAGVVAARVAAVRSTAWCAATASCWRPRQRFGWVCLSS